VSSTVVDKAYNVLLSCKGWPGLIFLWSFYITYTVGTKEGNSLHSVQHQAGICFLPFTYHSEKQLHAHPLQPISYQPQARQDFFFLQFHVNLGLIGMLSFNNVT